MTVIDDDLYYFTVKPGVIIVGMNFFANNVFFGGEGGITGISIWEEYFVGGWLIFLVLKEAFQEHFSATWKPNIDVCICNRKSKLVA